MAANSKPAPNGSAITVETLIAELGVVPTPTIAGEWTVDKATEAIFAPTGSDSDRHSKPAPNTSSPLPYFHLLELLKTTKREGWRRFGITHGESIADHMYRMSLMAMLAPPALAARLDMNRCIKMCLVHDMAEALVGDITPVDGVPKPEKSRREASTMDYITGTLLGQVGGWGGSKSGSGGGDGDNDTGAVGREIRAIWQEYEDAATPESHFVHDVDKMELLLQMHEYETRGQGHVDLGEFAYVATKMVLPETRAWAAALLQERDALWRSRGQAPPGQPTMPELEAAATSKTNGVDEANEADGHAPLT